MLYLADVLLATRARMWTQHGWGGCVLHFGWDAMECLGANY